MLSPSIVAILEFRDVSKTYGRQSRSHPALADVTFAIEPGELALILGPSGAGKSTVLKLILALERPDQGAVALAGREIHRLTRGSIPYLRRNVGVVFQDFKLISEATPLENVCLALEVSGLSPQVLRAKARVALAELSLDPNSSTPVRHLSGGEQQRVALARALAVEPAILLADEATGNLDPLLSREVFRQFERVCANGTTVLFASHSPMVHSQLQWTRMLRLEAGRLVDDSQRNQMIKEETPGVIHNLPTRKPSSEFVVVA